MADRAAKFVRADAVTRGDDVEQLRHADLARRRVDRDVRKTTGTMTAHRVGIANREILCERRVGIEMARVGGGAQVEDARRIVNPRAPSVDAIAAHARGCDERDDDARGGANGWAGGSPRIIPRRLFADGWMITRVRRRAYVSVGETEPPAENANMRSPNDSRERVRAEYLEMPGLHLTVDQVQRLCGIDRPECRTVLDTLVSERFLCVKPNGAYARAWDGHHPHAAKADLKRPTSARRAS
jgi:hypothetical protein